MDLNKSVDFGEIFDKVESYFKNLNSYQLYSWIAIAVGLLLIIVALILL